MGAMKALQIDLITSIKACIDRFLDGAACIPLKMEVIEELTQYFTFDELYISMDEIEDYLNDLEDNWEAANND